MMISVEELKHRELAGLEALYLQQGPAPRPPQGVFRGHFLRWLETQGARHPVWRPLVALMFQLIPFGVDFNERRWFFFGAPWLAAGRFAPRLQRSRWRETEVVCLDYDVSALPGPIRGLLYDEVQPLNESLCLGLGGINAPRGQGDLFFMALERVEA